MIREVYNGRNYDIDDKGSTVNEQSNYSIPGFKETTNFRPHYANGNPQKKKTNLIAKFFSNMARFGMRYEDQVIKNMRALPADRSMLDKQTKYLHQDLFNMTPYKYFTKSNKYQDFYEKDAQQKVDALRRLAIQPEMEDILDTFTNEAVVYDDKNTYFCDPYIDDLAMIDIKKSIRKKISDDLQKHFRRFYSMLNWKYNGWDDFKRYLVDGTLAFEIVWDSLEKPKEIIGLVPLDPFTLTKKFKNNKWYWVQYSGIQGRERTLLDSQIIYIAFQETNCLNRMSYLERLIRPFNIYRIIEQAQQVWTITNASYKMKITIPTKGMNNAMAKQTVAMAMNRYREDIHFNSDDGTLQTNGRQNMALKKEDGSAESGSGTPETDAIGGDGPELNDNEQLKYFKNQLYRMSKIPLSRFDMDNEQSWFGDDATSWTRDEINFGRYVTRQRNIFSQILIKPLQLQMAIDFPELQDQRDILQAISIHYNSYNVFTELMDLTMMQKRVEFIQSMKESMVDMDTEGNEIKFFSSKFLVQKYLKLPQQDLDLNDKLKKEEIEDLHLAGGENGYDDEGSGSGEGDKDDRGDQGALNLASDQEIDRVSTDDKNKIKAKLKVIKDNKKKCKDHLDKEEE